MINDEQEFFDYNANYNIINLHKIQEERTAKFINKIQELWENYKFHTNTYIEILKRNAE